MGQGECKPCSMADPTTATVKVDATLLSQTGAKPPAPEVAKQQAEEAERLRREAAAEQERQHRAAEERARHEWEDRQRQEAEARRALELQRQRAETEAQRQRREQQEAEAAERAAEEAAKERAAAAEAARKAEEARAAAAAKEQQEAQKKVDAFLAARGFKGVGAPRCKCFKTSYPLHAAVQENSAEMVRALLRCGADQTKKDSSGKTPREVAQKQNKKGSHDLVLAALVAAP